MTLRSTRHSGGLLLVLLISLLTVGCSATPDPVQSPSSSRPQILSGDSNDKSPAGEKVAIHAKPDDGAKQVNPAQPVELTAENGVINAVSLTEVGGSASIDGGLNSNGSQWRSTTALKFNRSYTLKYTVLDFAQRKITGTRTFSTVPTSHEADAVSYVPDGAVVGAGQPVQLTFSEPVINKSAVEKAIKTTSDSGQRGAFHWYVNNAGQSVVRYRPETFWQAGSTVRIELNLFGVDFGNGQIGNADKTITMKIGDKQVLEADAATHLAKLYVNDKLAKTIPVTMGDLRFPNRPGYMVLMRDKQETALFRAITIGLRPGDPGDYGALTVNYASRLTAGGAFIHQATDSAMPYIGQANLSHGCIGMSPEDAKYIFDTFLPGSLVHVSNTTSKEPIDFDDGFGDWNIPFSKYASR